MICNIQKYYLSSKTSHFLSGISPFEVSPHDIFMENVLLFLFSFVVGVSQRPPPLFQFMAWVSKHIFFRTLFGLINNSLEFDSIKLAEKKMTITFKFFHFKKGLEMNRPVLSLPLISGSANNTILLSTAMLQH